MTSQDKNTCARRKRSLRLAKSEHSSFKKYAEKFDTYLDMSEETGINRQILAKIDNGGTISQDTYNKLIQLNIIQAA